MGKVNNIHSFTLNEDGTFTENEVTDENEKALELKNKYGNLSIDVTNEVLGAIEHEDNRMYYEIKFWTDVRQILLDEIKDGNN